MDVFNIRNTAELVVQTYVIRLIFKTIGLGDALVNKVPDTKL